MPSLRHRTYALPLLCAGLAAPTAAAAYVPTPSPTEFAYDTAGHLGDLGFVVGVSQDGSEVLFDDRPDPTTGQQDQLIARNVVTKTSTRLLPVGDGGVAASANAQRVLYWTTRAADPADHNGTLDLYVLDRRTGLSTLVSRTLAGVAIGRTSQTAPAGAAISGDGNTVVYDDGSTGSQQVLRYVLATGKVSVVGPGTLLSTDHLDTTGSVVMTSNGLVTRATTLPIPSAPPAGGYRHLFRTFTFSPDGSTMVEDRSSNLGVELIATSTADGTQHTFPVPSFVPNFEPHVLSVANGGASILLSNPLTDPATATATQDEIDRVTASGTSTATARLPHPAFTDMNTVVSADGAYVAGRQLFQIGTSTGSGPVPTPIPPGVAPNPAPTAADAVRALKVYPGCSSGGLFAPLVRPSVVLDVAAPGSRKPTAATVRVILDSTGDLAGSFTLTGTKRQTLTYGFGGYSLSIATTFSDGTKATGLQHVATYTPIKNDTNPFSGTKGACQTANAL